MNFIQGRVFLPFGDMHWVINYFGIPYVDGGRDEKGVDCWGLVRLIYQKEFKIELPSYPGIASDGVFSIHKTIQEEEKEKEWIEVAVPFDGAAVGMSQREIIHHVGVFVTPDGGKIIHCQDKQSIIVDTRRRLVEKGFRVIRYYRHRLWPTS